jgi:hypothetical protein
MKKLLTNDVFLWNLIPAVLITITFFGVEKNLLTYFMGVIGIANWAIVFTLIREELEINIRK